MLAKAASWGSKDWTDYCVSGPTSALCCVTLKGQESHDPAER